MLLSNLDRRRGGTRVAAIRKTSAPSAIPSQSSSRQGLTHLEARERPVPYFMTTMIRATQSRRPPIRCDAVFLERPGSLGVEFVQQDRAGLGLIRRTIIAVLRQLRL